MPKHSIQLFSLSHDDPISCCKHLSNCNQLYSINHLIATASSFIVADQNWTITHTSENSRAAFPKSMAAFPKTMAACSKAAATFMMIYIYDL